MAEALLTYIPGFHMWFTLSMVFVAIVLYSMHKIPTEYSSLIVLTILLVVFEALPFKEGGKTVIDTAVILSGFSNQALIAVMALLVMGQAVVQTGALNEISNWILKIGRNKAGISLFLGMVVVIMISAVLNNTPVVVIFIPIFAALARKINLSVSKVMIPLSYAAILGGMLTLIGSSTNVLTSGILERLGRRPLGFFEFTLPASVLVGVGFAYIIFILPRLLPDRTSLQRSVVGEDEERKFVAQMEVDYSSKFVGQQMKDGSFKNFKDLTVRMIQRGEHAFLPPFEDDLIIRPRDIIVVSGTKKDLAQLYAKSSEDLANTTAGANTEDAAASKELAQPDSSIMMAEVVVAPASRIIGQNLEQLGFHNRYHCVVLGIQRQSRVIRSRVTEIRLAAGDVLLVVGHHEDVLRLHETKDLLLLEWTAEEIHASKKGMITAAIFFGVVGFAAFDVVPITISVMVGIAFLLGFGCINLRQVGRAMDLKIYMLIASSLALGVCLEETGAAQYLATHLVTAMKGSPPALIFSMLFLLIACFTNVLSNNSNAVLFTPIAVSTALQLGLDPRPFVYAVIFASDCSFVTPIGYQTNLLVMGPGHYRFTDYMRGGLPLFILIWLTASFFFPWYYHF
jgi:di/tricarboxylate transporter